MIDILYYYYYLFYKKSKVETQPQLTTIFTFSFLSTWIIMVSLKILFLHCLHIDIISRWLYLTVFSIIFLMMYWYYIKKKNGKKVIEQKPKLLNNSKLSVAFTIFFTFFPYILMFIERHILS